MKLQRISALRWRKRGLMRVDKWLEKLFPSSTGKLKMFELDGVQTLPNGELYSHVALLHTMASLPDAAAMVHCIGVYFCKGQSGEEVCSYRLNGYFAGSVVLYVIESELTERGLFHTHFLCDSTATSPSDFRKKADFLCDTLRPLMGMTAKNLPRSHSLNQTGVLQILVREGSGLSP